jgi:hypothetical protein
VSQNYVHETTVLPFMISMMKENGGNKYFSSDNFYIQVVPLLLNSYIPEESS